MSYTFDRFQNALPSNTEVPWLCLHPKLKKEVIIKVSAVYSSIKSRALRAQKELLLSNITPEKHTRLTSYATVEPFWLLRKEAFFLDVGLPPTLDCRLSRKNKRLGFLKENMCWQTKDKQFVPVADTKYNYKHFFHPCLYNVNVFELVYNDATVKAFCVDWQERKREMGLIHIDDFLR